MQKKKGISLIALVITIIVMIILAGAIILSLNNSGIIEKATGAVKATDEATVKELAEMAWAEAYADGVREVARKIYSKDNSNYGVVSTLTYGVQWDRAIQWFIDSGKMTLEEVNTTTGRTWQEM